MRWNQFYLIGTHNMPNVHDLNKILNNKLQELTTKYT